MDAARSQEHLIEVGSHLVSQMLDLTGEPEAISVLPPMSQPCEWKKILPAMAGGCAGGATAVELRFSFVPGFSEYKIEARGRLPPPRWISSATRILWTNTGPPIPTLRPARLWSAGQRA